MEKKRWGALRKQTFRCVMLNENKQLSTWIHYRTRQVINGASDSLQSGTEYQQQQRHSPPFTPTHMQTL